MFRTVLNTNGQRFTAVENESKEVAVNFAKSIAAEFETFGWTVMQNNKCEPGCYTGFRVENNIIEHFNVSVSKV
jgi:hypothetical protein